MNKHNIGIANINMRGISMIGTGIIIAAVILAGAAYFIFDRKGGEPSQDQGQNQSAQQSQSQNQNEKLTVGMDQPAQNKTENNFMHIITIETNVGQIQIETYDADAPKAVQNFISLAQNGFYDNLTFHRVIDGFMIQGGDPNGNGTGGPGYKFEDELDPSTESGKNGYKKGVVAMANSGPNTNGSQFFIMVADYPLQYNYTIFGRVIKGQEVADAIAKVTKNPANDMPLSPVVMKKVTVTDK